MRPTFLGFETCKRGIATNQKAMDIVGNNITNWDTPGYTRQRVDIVSVAPNTRATRFGMAKTDLAGQGVDMVGVSQTRDPYLDKRFRDEYGDASYFSEATTILSDLQTALKEFSSDPSDGGMGKAITDFTSALKDAADHPDDSALANAVAVSAKNMTQILHELSSKLDSVEEQAKFDMEGAVSDYNKYAEKLAELNKTICDDISSNGQSEYYGSNELLDERNLMLDELAKYGDVDVETLATGAVTVKVNGHMLIDGRNTTKPADRMNMARNTDGTVSIRWNSSGKDVNVTTGSLKAYTDYINGAGPNMKAKGETLERGVRYYREKLDTFANTLAKSFNKILPNAVQQPDNEGNWVADNSYKELFGARIQAKDEMGKPIPGKYISTTDSPVTAANIALSDEWLSDSNYVIFKEGVGNPDYFIQMVEVLNGTGIARFDSAGETFEGNFEEYLTDYVTTLATDVNYNSARQKATATIANEMLDRRDEVSGVNRDEETQTMMTYNKAYQAIARVLTTLDEALDVLINRTGLVGR